MDNKPRIRRASGMWLASRSSDDGRYVFHGSACGNTPKDAYDNLVSGRGWYSGQVKLGPLGPLVPLVQGLIGHRNPLFGRQIPPQGTEPRT
jgi:hypothetical protein